MSTAERAASGRVRSGRGTPEAGRKPARKTRHRAAPFPAPESFRAAPRARAFPAEWFLRVCPQRRPAGPEEGSAHPAGPARFRWSARPRCVPFLPGLQGSGGPCGTHRSPSGSTRRFRSDPNRARSGSGCGLRCPERTVPDRFYSAYSSRQRKCAEKAADGKPFQRSAFGTPAAAHNVPAVFAVLRPVWRPPHCSRGN